jgi:hypothetical protein
MQHNSTTTILVNARIVIVIALVVTKMVVWLVQFHLSTIMASVRLAQMELFIQIWRLMEVVWVVAEIVKSVIMQALAPNVTSDLTSPSRTFVLKRSVGLDKCLLAIIALIVLLVVKIALIKYARRGWIACLVKIVNSVIQVGTWTII